MRHRHAAIGAFRVRMWVASGLVAGFAASTLPSCSAQTFTVIDARSDAASDAGPPHADSAADGEAPDGSPDDLGNLKNLELWLRGDSLTSPSLVSPGVDSWRDDSPNHAAVTSAGSNPSCKSPVLIEGPNGKKAVAFDGVDACLRLPPGYADFTRGLSMFVVARTHPQVVPSTRGFLRIGAAGGPSINFGKDDATILRYVPSRSDGSSPNTASVDGGIVDDTWHTYAALQDGGAVDAVAPASIWRDGQQIASSAKTTTPPIAVRDQNLIGGITTARLMVDIAEMILFSRTVPEGERLVIEAYLRRKWL
ncbi:MAG: hypothetical protein JWM74_3667 [Myxococcaceae bacterium]|nr:hypothetical protein [Myxococcaceae bacterium]